MCKRSEETLFPCLPSQVETVRNMTDQGDGQPRQAVLLDQEDKTSRQNFFLHTTVLLYTVTKQTPTQRGVAGAKCLAIRRGP